MRPKLIIFDLFGTLVSPIPKLKKEDFFAFYQKIRIELQTKKEIEFLTLTFAQLMTKSKNWLDFSQRLLQKFVEKPDKELVNKLASFYQKNLIYQLYDDAKEVISLPYQKAILTSAAHFLFVYLGLGKYFQIFTPSEAKFLKPDPRAFLSLLKKMEVSAQKAVMVGDELERDLIPVKNLGLEVILVDRENKIKKAPVKKLFL